MIYFNSFAVAIEVMVVMVMVGTVISLKMGCITAEWETLFSFRVPMIIWRMSLLASPRTDSSAWMCSSLRKHNPDPRRINNNTKHKRINVAAGEEELCVPDIRIFGHQGGDLQEEQSGVSQLEHLSNGSNSTTQPICVFTLHIHTRDQNS